MQGSDLIYIKKNIQTVKKLKCKSPKQSAP